MIQLTDAKVTTRARTSLLARGFTTLDQVAGTTLIDLVTTKGIGLKASISVVSEIWRTWTRLEP